MIVADDHSAGAGFTVGRTPLIKLSPKKTWEGFIGGALLTLVASWYLADYMSRYRWMTCERNVRLPTFGPYWAAPWHVSIGHTHKSTKRRYTLIYLNRREVIA